MQTFLIGGNNKDGQWVVYLIVAQSRDEALIFYAQFAGFGDMVVKDIEDVSTCYNLKDLTTTRNLFCFGDPQPKV